MKAIKFQLNRKGTNREDDVRSICNAVSSVPRKGRFQVVIQNTPANTRLLSQTREERGICAIVAKHANDKNGGNDSTPNDIHYFHKKNFLVNILCEEDRMFKLMTDHIKQLCIDHPDRKKATMSAFLHTFVRVNMLTEEGLDKFISDIKEYWASRGVKFNN